MKRITLYIAIVAAALTMSLTACHSNENNYRQAYDKAMDKYRDGIGAEAYEAIQTERVRATHEINGDSVRMLRMYANVYDDSVKVAHPYNIVVAEFKQSFNAKSYRNRLRNEEGFPSYLLYGGPEKKYFVVIKGFDTKEDAAAFLKDLDKTVKIKTLVPRPWILNKI
ncbi:MAG: SPOR domain-containing protein [Muribaculaceae bacterium]|nr:SPOR domain-containing protein [Muribaculaceae bacterium]